ncbi:MAG: helix-turn-helix domain-containing protein [Acidimicrobiia bacterium]|nr:helix-turn-helix domain-containing protein [Acidimicrobiia bacterium]MDH4307337.1 helix-turn-helix domain-containing protein [Acidimicrobiia bacterium]MDH5294472.1 helix-turn-helix domain-containing protein [Acidimicrobiia bacterium]
MSDLEDLPPILDAAQVADLLGMNIQMVRRYAREGRIPAYKLPGGRTFKFFRDEVFDFVRAHPVVAEDIEDEEVTVGEDGS